MIYFLDTKTGLAKKPILSQHTTEAGPSAPGDKNHMSSLHNCFRLARKVSTTGSRKERIARLTPQRCLQRKFFQRSS